MLLAVDFRLDTRKEVVIVTPSRPAAEPLLAKLRATSLPSRVLAVGVAGLDLAAQVRLVPLLEGKVARKGRATAYVCERGVCELPTSDPEVFARLIRKVEPLAANSAATPSLSAANLTTNADYSSEGSSSCFRLPRAKRRSRLP